MELAVARGSGTAAGNLCLFECPSILIIHSEATSS
jgi:hypothetical protein